MGDEIGAGNASGGVGLESEIWSNEVEFISCEARRIGEGVRCCVVDGRQRREKKFVDSARMDGLRSGSGEAINAR